MTVNSSHKKTPKMGLFSFIYSFNISLKLITSTKPSSVENLEAFHQLTV